MYEVSLAQKPWCLRNVGKGTNLTLLTPTTMMPMPTMRPESQGGHSQSKTKLPFPDFSLTKSLFFIDQNAGFFTDFSSFCRE